VWSKTPELRIERTRRKTEKGEIDIRYNSTNIYRVRLECLQKGMQFFTRSAPWCFPVLFKTGICQKC